MGCLQSVEGENKKGKGATSATAAAAIATPATTVTKPTATTTTTNTTMSMPPAIHCCPAMVGPSVLDCDMANLGAEVQRVRDAGCDYVHLDVMDGHFVPAISFGPYVIECLRKHHPDIFFDCHMMTSEPENWVEGIAKSKGNKPGLTCYTFHAEATEPRDMTQKVIDLCKANGLKVGFAVSPDTPVDVVIKYADQLDLALIMTVHPGRGGQSFMAECMEKVRVLRAKFPLLDIEVDGGVKPATVDMAAEAGANLIVSGSGVFKAENMADAIKVMQQSVRTLGNGKKANE